MDIVSAVPYSLVLFFFCKVGLRDFVAGFIRHAAIKPLGRNIGRARFVVL
jgi:hypothetical protein